MCNTNYLNAKTIFQCGATTIQNNNNDKNKNSNFDYVISLLDNSSKHHFATKKRYSNKFDFDTGSSSCFDFANHIRPHEEPHESI